MDLSGFLSPLPWFDRWNPHDMLLCATYAWGAAAEGETGPYSEIPANFVTARAANSNGRYTPPYALLFCAEKLDRRTEQAVALVAADRLHQRLRLRAAAAGIVGAVPQAGRPHLFKWSNDLEVAVLATAGPRYQVYLMTVIHEGI